MSNYLFYIIFVLVFVIVFTIIIVSNYRFGWAKLSKYYKYDGEIPKVKQTGIFRNICVGGFSCYRQPYFATDEKGIYVEINLILFKGKILIPWSKISKIYLTSLLFDFQRVNMDVEYGPDKLILISTQWNNIKENCPEYLIPEELKNKNQIK